MAKQLFNLTLLAVSEEIENILASYPQDPYQQAFADMNLRQDLIVYVLLRVKNKYIEIEETQLTFPPKAPAHCSEHLLDIEHYIHLGICDILNDYQEINCPLPARSNFIASTSLATANS